MNRRTFLTAVSSLGGVGVLAYRRRAPVEQLSVRVWLSDAARSYPTVTDRIEEYLGYALDLEFWTVDLSIVGVRSLSTEDGAVVTTSGEWPAAVIREHSRGGDTGHVNLLVTDGQMKTAPTGYGVHHIASVGGAKHIDRLPPIEGRPPVVPHTTPDRVMQVLIHEVGHALGLAHDHGVAVETSDAIVATPMLSAYAWDQSYDGDRSRCGTSYPDERDRRRKLSYDYSSCARQTLATYRGGIALPKSESQHE